MAVTVKTAVLRHVRCDLIKLFDISEKFAASVIKTCFISHQEGRRNLL
jgi:hypothetical protein